MKKTGIIALVCAIALIFGVFAGCSSSNGNGDKINATIILVDEDQQEYKYDINVAGGQSLRSALFEAGLITEETFGALFVENIDGHIADTLNDGVTWLPCDEAGNQLEGDLNVEAFTLFDTVSVKDGQTIKLVYYVVPDMD